jgi:hypothetical protein
VSRSFFYAFPPREKNMPFYEERSKKAIFKNRHSLFSFEHSHERRLICHMLESQFQAKLIKELKKLFPGCIVMKSDSGYLQGIPDLLILFDDKWAALECKQHAGAKKQPNQEYYVGKMDEMSFSRFICPENKEEVLHDLQQSFQS